MQSIIGQTERHNVQPVQSSLTFGMWVFESKLKQNLFLISKDCNLKKNTFKNIQINILPYGLISRIITCHVTFSTVNTHVLQNQNF